MDLLARLKARAGAVPRRVLFCDTGDARVLAAVAELSDTRIGRPILFDPSDVPGIERYRAELAKRRGLPLRVAAKILERPVNLVLTSMMLAASCER